MTDPNTVLLVAAIASFSTPFMLSAINVALPHISRDLGMNALAMGWISLSFLIVSTVFLVPAGRAADIYGRKRVFTAGFAVFTAASALCAMAGRGWQLIMFRSLQGLGSAMIFGTSVAMLTSVYPGARRGRALGIVSSSVYLGLSLGPFLGGILVESLSWRSIFYLNIPMGAAVLYLLRARVRGEWRGESGAVLEPGRAALYVLSLAAAMLGASSAASVRGLLLLAAGGAGMAAFLRLEDGARHPVLGARSFLGNKVFAYSCLAALLSYCASFAVSFLLSLYLQYVKGMGPGRAGTLLMAQPLVMTVFSPLAGRLSDRIEPRVVSSWGMALTTAGLLFFSGMDVLTPIWVIAAGLGVLGLGLALFASPNTNAVMASVEPRAYSLASSLLATMRVGGQMSSMAVVMLLFSLSIGGDRIGPGNLDRFLSSFSTAVYIFSALSFLGIFASLKRGDVRTRSAAGTPQNSA